MSLVVALVCGAGAAIAYGAATAVEHSAAHTDDGAGDARGLVALLRNPRWLIGFAGDGVGLVLQVIALATGPVVLVQPLLVLALPVSLPIAWWLGGRRPSRGDYLWSGLIIAGLALFFGIVGNPGDASVITDRQALIVIVVALVAGAAALGAVHGRSRSSRALVYGTVAGVWSGVVGVLVDAAAAAWEHHGIRAFVHGYGLVPLGGFILVGALALVLTQTALQIGDLGASYPANLSADPVIAVVLGATVLGENIPTGPGQLVAYAVGLGAIVTGAIRLARRPGQ
jgi:drug/metabolite transporter (DMT)-like permease